MPDKQMDITAHVSLNAAENATTTKTMMLTRPGPSDDKKRDDCRRCSARVSEIVDGPASVQ